MKTLAELKLELVRLQDYWRRRNSKVVADPDDPEDMAERLDAFEVMSDLKRQIAEIENRVLK